MVHKNMRVIYSKVMNSMWPWEWVEIFPHTRCAAFAPRTHGLEDMPGCSVTERSIKEIDGRWDEITEISGNILFFFLKKTSPIQGDFFLMILKKIGVIYFQSRRRVGVK